NLICKYVMSGDFDIGLLSITYTTNSHLNLYISKGKIGYMVKVSAVQDKALDLTDDISKVIIANLNHYYKEPINIPKDEEIQQIYKFFMYYPAMLVITDKKEYMISLNERQKGTRFWED